MKRYLGRGIGLVLGLPAGAGGAAFGFLAGWLVDQFLRDAHGIGSFDRFVAAPETERRRGRVLVFGTSVLCASVMAADRVPAESTVERELALSWPTIKTARHGRSKETVVEKRYVRRALQRIPHLAPDRTADCIALRFQKENRELLNEVLNRLVGVACLDVDGMTGAKRAIIAEIADRFGISREEIVAFEQRHGGLDRNACRVLGISPEADRDELRVAYRQLAAHMHPDTAPVLDQHQKAELEEAFLRIRNAYDILTHQLKERERLRVGSNDSSFM